jgi:hypothetical protein
MDCTEYGNMLVADRPEYNDPLYWGKRILFYTYKASCQMEVNESAEKLSKVVDAAVDLFTDFETGYNPHSTTIHNDLVRLSNSLDGLLANMRYVARTPGGGQAAARSLGEIRNIINQIQQ